MITTFMILGLIIIFLAGITSGLTGFGFALVSVPLMMLFLPLKTITPIILLLQILINLFLLFEARKFVNLKRIWPLILVGILGIPLGTYLLIFLDVTILKISVGLIIILFAIAFLIGFKKEIKKEKSAFAIVGFISGILNGSTAMGGPPVVLFFTNQNIEKRIFRANLIAYFTALNLITIPFFLIGNLITLETIGYTALFMPALFLGGLTGTKLIHKINEKLFKKIVLIIIIVSGLLSTASGLGII
tara:strand:+ start:4960 stop:5697 length:738 start_codon:yes stop_codon:yes gene_type:complete